MDGGDYFGVSDWQARVIPGQKSASRKFRHIGKDKHARDLQSDRTLRGRKDDAIATLRLSEIAIWRQLISRRDTFSFSAH